MRELIEYGKTECNIILKGFVNNENVILSTIKFKSLYKENEEYKEFDLSNLSLKKFQITNIKGFKRFLRNKDITEFKDITGTNTEGLIFNGLTFKKENNNAYQFIAVYLENERIISLNQDYLKQIFRELKDIESLRIFINKDIPAYFELNGIDGFLIAPCMREDY